MIFLNIDQNHKKKYIYQQIYEEIKQNILERKLQAHEQLPSKRRLAKQLHVSVNSVTNAYEQLLAEGYIYAIERSGYYVENITQFIQKKNETKSPLPDDLKEHELKKENWLSLSHMTADISMFPFKQWMKCQQLALKHHECELSEITHPQGPYIVRKTIAQVIARTRNVICEPEQIVIGAGTQTLIHRLMDMFKKDTVIAIENPGYARFYTLLKRIGFTVRPVRLDDKGIHMKHIIASQANIVFVTPSHQFPTGKIMPITRRIELLNWAAQSKHRYIVEDDYDSEFKYETDNIPSLHSLNRNQRVIYTGTFSKTLLPSFRISYMVLPPHLLREYRKRYMDVIQGNNSLSLFTLHYFIQTGEYAKHIRRMTNHYEMKRKQLIKKLKSRFKQRIDIDDIPAGLHFLAHFYTDQTYEAIEKRAEQERLEVYSMKRFTLQPNSEREKYKISLVIGFANIQKDQMNEAIERLDRIIYPNQIVDQSNYS